MKLLTSSALMAVGSMPWIRPVGIKDARRGDQVLLLTTCGRRPGGETILKIFQRGDESYNLFELALYRALVNSFSTDDIE